MEAGRNQRTGDAVAPEGLEIGAVAHPAGRVDRAARGGGADGAQPVEVRPGAAADPRQRHDDEPLRPRCGVVDERRRPLERVAAKIERQHDTVLTLTRKMPHQRRVGLAFAADDQVAQAGVEPARGRRNVGGAVVDPEDKRGKLVPQAAQDTIVVTGAFDGVEIGKVEGGEGMDREQTPRHVRRVAGRRQRRHHRLVALPLAHPGAHHGAAAQIKNRNDVHDSCFRISRPPRQVDDAAIWGYRIIVMGSVIGWDIGGVHLKAARAESGRIVKAVQLAAPLRGGTDLLAAAFAKARAELGAADRHVATMTGELADTFASRPEGVECLAALAARELAGAPLVIYAGPAGYVAPEAARRHAGLVASANWHACAAYVATRRRDALFIDMGSTTTDVIPVADGRVAARGYTDAGRLAAGELVYTGLVRSFLMASAERAPFNGAWMTLVNENFANMADVYRVLGMLPAGADMMGTADGRDKTRKASLARLARMIGADVDDADDLAWTALAQWFAEMQVRRVMDAAMLAGSRCRLPAAAPVVSAGAGAPVIREIARRLGRDEVPFDMLLNAAPEARAGASQCAPAAALALLLNG